MAAMFAPQRCVRLPFALLCAHARRVCRHGSHFLQHALQVWTYKGRVAFVLSVLEKNRPIADRLKLQRLSQIMLDIMGGDLGIVTMDQVCLCPGRSGPCQSICHHHLQ